MHGEIVLAALVLLVAILVAADFFRRTGAAPHEHPAGNEPGNEQSLDHDAGRDPAPARRAGSAPSPFPHEAAVAARRASTRPDGARPAGIRPDRARPDSARPDSARPDSARPDSARQDRGAGTLAPAGPGGPRANWPGRTRLGLLAVVSAAAAALATAGFIRAAGAFRRASADANVSSMHDGAIVSAVLALLFAAVILAAGLWSALILIRSVLRPLRQLRAGAVELTEVWLPDALRTISQADGEGRRPAVKTIGVSA